MDASLVPPVAANVTNLLKTMHEGLRASSESCKVEQGGGECAGTKPLGDINPQLMIMANDELPLLGRPAMHSRRSKCELALKPDLAVE